MERVVIDFSEEQNVFHFNRGEHRYGINDYVRIGEISYDLAQRFVKYMNKKYPARYPCNEDVKDEFREWIQENKTMI